MKKLLLLTMVLCFALWCQAQDNRVIMGAEQTSEYFPILKGKHPKDACHLPFPYDWKR